MTLCKQWRVLEEDGAAAAPIESKYAAPLLGLAPLAYCHYAVVNLILNLSFTQDLEPYLKHNTLD